MPGEPSSPYPENPILCQVRRGGRVESVHRGAWCLTDTSGEVLAGEGSFEASYYARSSIKAIQLLPLFETGAAERFGFEDPEVALAIASHSGEPCHTRVVQATLERLGLEVGHLQCGVHPPNDSDERRRLLLEGHEPSALHNNCSGKHAGFLALAQHLGVEPEDYLEPTSESQALVRGAIEEICGLEEGSLVAGLDGCSAPTYPVPLRALATGFARVSQPEGLGEERRAIFRRITGCAARHPELVAGNKKRIDTDILRASGGRLFPKIGAEAVHLTGIVEGDRALAVKIDDGGWRGLHAVVAGLLSRLKLAREDELAPLTRWSEPLLRNHAGLDAGRIELCFSV